MLAYVYLYLHVKRCRTVNYSCAAVRLTIDWALNTRHSDDDLWGFSLQWQKSKEVHISGFQSQFIFTDLHRSLDFLGSAWMHRVSVCAHVGFVPEYLLRPFYHAWISSTLCQTANQPHLNTNETILYCQIELWMFSSPPSISSVFYCFCVHWLPVAMHNWMAKWGNVFLNEHLNSGSSRALFLCVSTPRIVVVSLQGRWMKRKVNECGEHAEPLWLCVSLIRSWWEAVWGRDGAYYCYGTLRTVHEALLACLFCGQQYTRYKHCKQHSKGNHYSSPKEKKKYNKFCKGIITFLCYQAEKRRTFGTFLVPRIFSFSSYTFSATASPPSRLNLLFSQSSVFFPICSTLSSLLLHLCLFFSEHCFLSGSLCEELGRRATWSALACESARVERIERTDSPNTLERDGGKGAVAKSSTLHSPLLYVPLLHSGLLNGLQYTEAITVKHPGCRGEI